MTPNPKTASPLPPPSPYPEPAETDLFDYALIRDWVGFVLRSVVRRRGLAAWVFLSVLGLSLLSLKVLPIRWQVQASVLALRNPLMGTLSNPGMNREWDAPTRAAREIVIRRDNLRALTKQTDFLAKYLASRSPLARARDWVFETVLRQPRDPEEAEEGLVDSLEERLWVVVSPEGAVTITFQWSNPELAYQIVEAALQSFIEARYASEINAVGEAIAILQAHDNKIQREIASAIVDLEAKEKTLRIRSPVRREAAARPRVARDEELSRVEGVLSARRRALADLEDFRQRRIAELQSQLAAQLNMYAPRHPTVLTTRQNLESLQGPSPQIESLRAEVRDLEAEVARRGGVPTEVLTGPSATPTDFAEARLRLESEDPRLEFERRQLHNLLRQHSNLVERIDAARVEMETAQAAFKYRYSVITPPLLPKKPIKPYALIVFLAGAIGGVAVAIFATALADLRSGRVVERWQVTRKLGLPVLAETRR